MQSTDSLKSILLLAANPKGTKSLRLQEEEREIKERLRLAGYGKTPINSTGATRPRDIQQAMLDFKPQIVHFSGHGAEQEGLVFEDKTGQEKVIGSEALADLFRLFSNRVECVVLNACYSKFQAEAIAQHINYVIGMSKEIGDKAAIEFSVGFYSALGASESIEFAYEMGCNAILLEGFPENLTPVLYKKGKLRIRFYKSDEILKDEKEKANREMVSDVLVDVNARINLPANQSPEALKREFLETLDEKTRQHSNPQNSPIQDETVQNLIDKLFDALSSPNSEIGIQKFEEIAHRSLLQNGQIDPSFRKNCFDVAMGRLSLYKQPLEIISTEPTGRNKLGSRGNKEDGREEKFIIARKNSLGGFEGHIRVFFPAHSKMPKISGINF
jgi:hypothetical protein